MNNFKIILLLLMLAFSKVGVAQSNIDSNKNYNEFVSSFRQTVDYPVELFRSCTATVCLLKIQIDPDKNIVAMTLSDSADPLFKKTFELQKQKLDVRSLVQYLKGEYAGNSCQTYLIPLSYRFRQMPCPPSAINITLLDNYLKFEGKELESTVVFLKPINSAEHIQH